MKDLDYSVVVFAYNLESSIGACIKSVLSNGLDENFQIFVIANGCTDATETIVKKLQAKNTNIELISIKQADKCNAWNEYVHHLLPKAEVHFFIDGDVQITSGSLASICNVMHSDPLVTIVGGVPIVGRDRNGWIRRMQTYGRVSGGLYALSDKFIRTLRSQKIMMPIGFIGEDFLISALAKNITNWSQFNLSNAKLKIDTNAGFWFKSLSRKRIPDYVSYARRLIRYRMRDYEISMLLHYFQFSENHEMPKSVKELYNQSSVLPDYYWRGRYTLIDWPAVFKIRRLVKQKSSRFSINRLCLRYFGRD